MALIIRLTVSITLIAVLLSGCTITFGEDSVEKEEPAIANEESDEAKAPPPPPPGTVRPELDFSSEIPDCKVAAQRIADHIQVGMTLGEVKRLVGKPRLIVPGGWLWTNGFVFGDGAPSVKYGFGASSDDNEITSFISGSASC